MTEKEIYERARYVASEEDSLRHGSLGFAKHDSDYELIVESYFEGAMWAHEQAVKALNTWLETITKSLPITLKSK